MNKVVEKKKERQLPAFYPLETRTWQAGLAQGQAQLAIERVTLEKPILKRPYSMPEFLNTSILLSSYTLTRCQNFVVLGTCVE